MSINDEINDIVKFCEELIRTIPDSRGASPASWMTNVRGLTGTLITSNGIRDDIYKLIPMDKRGQFDKAVSFLKWDASTSYSQARNPDIIKSLNFIIDTLNCLIEKNITKGAWISTEIQQHDALLPIASRKFFDADIVQGFSESDHSEPLAIMLIDIDYFKAVNDTHGHQIGDEVLVKVAETIKRVVGLKGKAYRYGGEELVALVPNNTAEEIMATAERLRNEICKLTFSVDGLNVAVSVGISTTNAAGVNDVVTLIKSSDDALYRAKANGRNQTELSK